MTVPAKSVREITATIRKLRQRTCADIIEIGRLLAEAKKLLGHSSWLHWLETQFAWSRQTADNFIAVHKRFGNNVATVPIVGTLDPTALYALAQQSTPPQAVTAVVKLIKAGNPPSATDVKKIIREIKCPPCDDPPPVPSEPEGLSPSVREAALAGQFRDAVAVLVKLAARPSKTFAGAVPAHDLDMVANFLRQIASKEKAT
jgi:hypothetical protein